jgi:hypothetical protein
VLKRLTAFLSAQGAIVALALSFVAAAEAGWLPPVDISETGAHIGGPQVVLDSGGNATAVWDQWNGKETVVESAFRPAGEAWQAPMAIAAGNSPQIAVDGAGDVTVVWESYAGTNRLLIQAAERPAEEGWRKPVVLGEVQTMMAPEPSIGVGQDGDAIVLWHAFGVIKSAFRPAEGTWQTPVDVSDPHLESYVPELAVDASGDASAVWMQEDGSQGSIHSAYRPAGGEWGEPTLVSEAGESAGDANVAINADGDATAVWSGEESGLRTIRAALRPAGGAWESPASISTPGNTVVGFPQVALDGDGDTIAAWADTTDESSNYALATVSYRPAGGGWGPPEELSEDGGNGYPLDVVFDTSGNAAIAWERDNGKDNVVQVAYRPTEGDWEEPTDLSESGTDAMDASLVLDAPGDDTAADGDATAIWTSARRTPCEKKLGCAAYAVQAAGFDAVAPPAERIEAPESGSVGEPIEVSIEPEDIWLPELDFGDGVKVSATSATHVYEKEGSFELSFASTNVLGYRTVVHRIIAISSSAAKPPESEAKPPESEAGETESGAGEPSAPLSGSEQGADESPIPPVAPGSSSDAGSAASPAGQVGLPDEVAAGTGACVAARAAYSGALNRFRGARTMLHAGPPERAREFRRMVRKRAAAVHRSARRLADFC